MAEILSDIRITRDTPYMGCLMMTSSNGNIFRVSGHLCGEFTGPGELPTQRPVAQSFDVFFDLRLNKRLSKQSWGWSFDMLSYPLWRHCNVLILKRQEGKEPRGPFQIAGGHIMAKGSSLGAQAQASRQPDLTNTTPCKLQNSSQWSGFYQNGIVR